jgi:hypothetical protein
MSVFSYTSLASTGARWLGLALAGLLAPFAYADVIEVTTLVDEDDGAGAGAGTSLRDAIAVAQEGDIITFDPDLFLAPPVTLPLTLGGLLLDTSITIAGPGVSVDIRPRHPAHLHGV